MSFPKIQMTMLFDVSDGAHSIKKALSVMSEAFEKSGIDSPDFEARQLLSAACHISPSSLPVHYGDIVDGAALERLKVYVSDRLSGRPLQYILGEWEFYSLKFAVGEGVLIPRPETELIVDEARKISLEPGARAADLCSGSGCIAVAFSHFAGVQTDAYEKYDTAFSFLEKNIVLNGEKAVTAVKADIKTCEVPTEKYDIIMSNPPYICDSDKPLLQREVHYEPETALFAGDGLEFYRVIASRWITALKKGGYLLLEVGAGQDSDVTALISRFFENVTSVKDLSGIKRVIIGKKRL